MSRTRRKRPYANKACNGKRGLKKETDRQQGKRWNERFETGERERLTCNKTSNV